MTQETAKVYQPSPPSSKQPEFVYLARASHRIPVGRSPHKYFTLDRIRFDCPLHPPIYGYDDLDEVISWPLPKQNYAEGEEYSPLYERVFNYGSHEPLEIAGRGPNAGMYVKGHRITLKAQAGKPTVYRSRKGTFTEYIAGYVIEGTKITITTKAMQVIGHCDQDWRFSEELYQETGEKKYPRKVGYTENYASPVDGLIATVRVVS